VLLAAGAWAGWEAYGEPRWQTKRWGAVEPGLVYRSGRLPLARAQAVLARHGIRVLIDLTEPGADNRFQPAEQAAAEALGIDYHNFPLCGDGTGDLNHYAEALAVLHEARRAGQPVLVHCAAGAQRTGGVVAVYRLLMEGRDPESVRAEMRRYGWKPGKDRVLLDYLNTHMQTLAGLLRDRGVLERVPAPLPVL